MTPFEIWMAWAQASTVMFELAFPDVHGARLMMRMAARSGA